MNKIFGAICFFILLATVVGATYHQSGYQYLSPKPGSIEVSKYSTIFLRFSDALPLELRNLDNLIQVAGDKGGAYQGDIKIASDDKTIIFKPNRLFVPGESVHVTISPDFSTESQVVQFDYSFQVSKQESNDYSSLVDADDSLLKSVKTVGAPMIMPNGVSVPSDFPHVNVAVNNNPAEGYIFLNNWGGYPYSMILDNSGSPIWYIRGVNDGDRRRDVKVQDNGILTMRVLGNAGYDFGDGFIGLDSTYTFIRGFYATDGYHTDEHELQVLDNGNYLLVALRSVKMDMSKVVAGGQTNATINESGIQEFTPEGELIFHWRALDNFDLADMFGYTDEPPGSSSFRFPHMNSIDIDDDGHIILSSKRLSEVTKIHRQTGEFIWRLGGANNEFEFINDPLDGFSLQHSARVLGDGFYTIFDNGVLHEPQVSRALEYKIDAEKKTATLVWSYQREKPDDYAYHMGNVQRLGNGNTFVNWAVQNMPKAEEVRPDGSTVYEMNFIQSAKSYRAFRFPWNGKATKPVLYVEPQADNVTLIYNKFGDPNVDFYNIYAGRGLNPTQVVATSKETMIKLTTLENRRRYFIRVTAVDKDGNESPFSNQEEIVVNIIQPGEELVDNGNFSNGQNSWDWLVRNGAQANWSIENSAAVISITNGGSNDHDIQLTQAGIALVQNREYDFEFDAWAAAPRTIEAKIAQNGGSFTDYSQVGLTALSRSKKRYTYRFRMQESTDMDARIVFNVGANTSDVSITNVSAKMVGETGLSDQAVSIPNDFELSDNYPNPFNARTTIRFTALEKSDVTVTIYNILGAQVKNYDAGFYNSGSHAINLYMDDLPSGVYLYRLSTRNISGVISYSRVKKMTLLR
ncbi:aryl-sulfate sulfotransferase [candidate division KSB1 bacterium]|nr:aryl-sulfate sulfotransferase [candidate division KSB1 bacterium]